MPAVRVLVQARMSSSRFPGKVLAPIGDKPLVQHVLERAAEVVGRENVTLATSVHASEEPLVLFVRSIGFAVHRGDLDDVLGRFQEAIRAQPAERFFRVSADSPALDPTLLRRALQLAAPDVDIVTNVHPRTFPPGRSVELVSTATFLALDSSRLSRDEREHVTLHFYRNADRFRVVNFTASQEEASLPSLAVDTVEDFKRVEAYLAQPGAA
jgi:spore coat polysaccharide biosynthesis protein SpsF